MRGLAAQPGGATPGWSRFFDSLGQTSPGDLNQRSQLLARQVRDNGITYNVYADASGPQRPWSVDLFPLLIEPEAWRRIESGVVQRMRVLESVMADIYGPQRLIAGNLLPPALVHGHPGYLRSMRGATPAGGRFLHIAAFDLARGTEGLWWVVSQRTQAPSGLGYLLENRSLVSRLFPEAYRALRVQRLAASYRTLVDSLRARAPTRGEEPRIALLTPGPYNETYFEHAYLARYLGLTLVEGGDLTVRGERLYLKTLRGLEPVHGLLKRLDDEFLDPLELRADSQLGVPGLMQAVRAGNLLVANAPGSAVLESPALLGFLPALSEHLLGEPLSLPSLPTWWCGERAALESVLPELARNVIKPTYGAPGSTTVLGRALTRRGLDEWAGRLTREPDDYTVQAYLPLSQMPTWDGRRLAPRSLLLRVFAMTDGAGGWQVLPGGLTRLAGASEQIASMQRGGSSVDTWVLGEDFSVDPGAESDPNTEDEVAPAARGHEEIEALSPTPGPAPVPSSRAAENLFWLGRYLERLAHRLRQAQTNGTVVDEDAQRHDLVAMRQAASAVRDRLSPVQWQRIQKGEDLPSLEDLIRDLAGRQDEDEGWRLLATGQAIERMASQPDIAHLAWRLSDDLSTRLFTHSDDARYRVGA
ncbi:MAG: circularly permuted type 2 ATP-grasp protein [Ramlibacter sp.]|uniref:circularly permuted type 2 ATP-grasp protein n=1 Tax=Ramlibacter sp. TaxID=1917967 RepID=UPI0026213E55|nr:circularly permuted type 2 ATP-grasp protein [Ramlibacter sp.]MDH4377109.1 circularly permuted type 2 ATP-grasp protein [Ramlibacter sp.]